MALGDDAVDGGRDCEGRETLVALHLCQSITGTHALTNGSGNRLDASVETRTDVTDGLGIGRDPTIDGNAFIDDRRAGDLGGNSQRLAHGRLDHRASFEAVIRPAMGGSSVRGRDADAER